MDYDTLANKEIINKTAEMLKANGVEPILVETGAEALAKIKELIPKDASVMNGSSTSLNQIGFVDFLKAGEHGWNNLHAAIIAETDKAKQSALRKQAALSDFYLGSVHALSETGEFLVASASGSQLPHIVLTSPNLIFVVGAQKIVPNLQEAMKRLEEYVVPLEEARMQKAMGMGTSLNKIVTFKKEPPYLGRKVRMIIVNEKLGF